jgi:hypothetical protein
MEDSLAQNGGCNGRIGKPKTINLKSETPKQISTGEIRLISP